MTARLLAAAVSLGILSACQTVPPTSEHSSRFTLPPGSVVQLNQPLEVPRGRYNIYVQYGEARPELIRYAPYCYFEAVRSKSALQSSYTIRAGEFQVVGSDRRHDRFTAQIVGPEFGAIQVAAAGGLRLAQSFVGENGASSVYINTRMDLRSDSQPEVRRLVCGVYADPHMRTHLSLVEIRGVLGGIATIRTGF